MFTKDSPILAHYYFGSIDSITFKNFGRFFFSLIILITSSPPLFSDGVFWLFFLSAEKRERETRMAKGEKKNDARVEVH